MPRNVWPTVSMIRSSSRSIPIHFKKEIPHSFFVLFIDEVDSWPLWLYNLFDSWPLKVTFSTLRYNISAKGHAKRHYDWLPGCSRHFQGQTLCIPKRDRFIRIGSILFNNEEMDSWPLKVTFLTCLLKDMPKDVMTECQDGNGIFKADPCTPIAKKCGQK